jgi:hypothetical protein
MKWLAPSGELAVDLLQDRQRNEWNKEVDGGDEKSITNSGPKTWRNASAGET